jgi:hypothetical protein
MGEKWKQKGKENLLMKPVTSHRLDAGFRRCDKITGVKSVNHFDNTPGIG